jgi:hypothetical protein
MLAEPTVLMPLAMTLSLCAGIPREALKNRCMMCHIVIFTMIFFQDLDEL